MAKGQQAATQFKPTKVAPGDSKLPPPVVGKKITLAEHVASQIIALLHDLSSAAQVTDSLGKALEETGEPGSKKRETATKEVKALVARLQSGLSYVNSRL